MPVKVRTSSARFASIRAAFLGGEVARGFRLQHGERVDEVLGGVEVFVRLLRDRVGHTAQGHQGLGENRLHEKVE
jgi:hypothetical protein